MLGTPTACGDTMVIAEKATLYDFRFGLQEHDCGLLAIAIAYLPWATDEPLSRVHAHEACALSNAINVL